MSHARPTVVSRPTSFAPALAAALIGLFALLVAFVPPARAVPDGRAYEMVSPLDKGSGEVGAGGFQSGYRASINGDSVAYTALGGFADSGSNTAAGGYLGIRGENSWETTSLQLPILPSLDPGFGDMGPVKLANDLGRVVIQTNMDPVSGARLPMISDYLLDSATGETALISPLSTSGDTYPAPVAGEIAGSASLDPLYLETNGAPLVGAAEGLSGRVVYRYSDGVFTVASVLPNGTPTVGNLASGYNGAAALTHPTVENTVSVDGSVMFFANTGSNNSGPQSITAPLYRRDFSGATPVTDLVNASENTTESVPLGDAVFTGASADGEVAYFTSTQELVDADTDGSLPDLYRYDQEAPVGSRLTLVSQGLVDDGEQVEFVYGASADGGVIYFTTGSSGLPRRLYVWDDGSVSLITEPGEGNDFRSSAPSTSPNGEYFEFLTREPGLTPEDNGGLIQAYVFELSTDTLVCVSCNPVGPNTYEARIDRGTNTKPMTEQARRYATNSGAVFFDTAEPLVPEDTNGKQDAYMWSPQKGTELLSSGRSNGDSYFVDASADGANAFFVTRDQLVGWDTDSLLDLYVARIGGGLPEPPDSSPQCVGAECQGSPSPPPPHDELGSTTFHGKGSSSVGRTHGARCAARNRRVRHLARRLKRLKQMRGDSSRRRSQRTTRRISATSHRLKRARRRADRCHS